MNVFLPFGRSFRIVIIVPLQIWQLFILLVILFIEVNVVIIQVGCDFLLKPGTLSSVHDQGNVVVLEPELSV
jgi:hypothetical protein